MFYIGLFLLSWLGAGIIGTIPLLLTKDFGDLVNKTAKDFNIQEQSNPKLFFFVLGALGGYLTLALELRGQFRRLVRKG